MNGDKWRKLEAIYHDALAQPIDQRAAFVARACGNDTSLAREIESLLAHEGEADALLESASVEQPPPALTPGSMLGGFRILESLGAGGMGEVYRASDTRLHREVAIKVLPMGSQQDEAWLARFRREARALASLNHPGIASVFGLEEHKGGLAIVMELAEGVTLAERIGRGPIPASEALQIALRIADALEHAHEKGIIHRDLKPANVKVAAGGAVKLLDFGLAKIAAAARPHQSSPALSATGKGVILGTAAYMSPEQARGEEVDRRADIWAFGAVLYEMLCARKPFAGGTVTDILANVVKSEPDWQSLPPDTHPSIRNLIERCLRKDRKQRLQAIGEARITIEESLAAPDAAPIRRSPRPRQILPWIFAATLLVALAALAFVHFRQPAVENRLVTFPVLPPDNTSIREAAVSPDGRRLAFVARSASGRTQLWLRDLASLPAQPLDGTDGAAFPFWSPDSRSIAFFANRSLKSIEAAGGPPRIVADAMEGRGGTWSKDGVILFAPNIGGGIHRVSASGGEVVAQTRANPARHESAHRWPAFLPDGRHFLYTVRSNDQENSGIYLASLDSGKPTRLLSELANVACVATQAGQVYLMFPRNGSLMAAEFDPVRLRMGEAAAVAGQQPGFDENLARAEFSVSTNGVLVLSQPPGSVDRLAWFDRAGNRTPLEGDPMNVLRPSVSPDESKVVVDRWMGATGPSTLWTLDFSRRISTRFTLRQGYDASPLWSPDGRMIAFVSDRQGPGDLFWQKAGGASEPELLLKTPHRKWLEDWSADGRFLVYSEFPGNHKGDLWVLPLNGDRRPIPFLQTEFAEEEAGMSPDGKWIAYVSDESGKREVYVQPFPPTGDKWQISKGGGGQPKWRRDGKELFFGSSPGRFLSVRTNIDGRFQAGIPEVLFEALDRKPGPGVSYAVTRNGQRFLIPVRTVEADSKPATVVLNWTEALRR